MAGNIRTFIAVKIEPDPELLDLVKECKMVFKDEAIKWVKEDNLHLTLKFLGDTTENQVFEVNNTLEKIAGDYLGFDFHLHGMGYFGSTSSPRVLFVGITEFRHLKVIAEELQESLNSIGFEKETRSFNPHLTLGRIKFLRDKKGFHQFVEHYKNVTFQNVYVSEIIFYQSILKAYTPEYVPLKTIRLNG